MKLNCILFFFLSVSVCAAQTDSMIVEFMNGSTQSYAISSVREIRFSGTVTDVKEQERLEQVLKSFVLHQNYPNPFNPTTTIGYELPCPGSVDISIFDMQGRCIRAFNPSRQQAGVHSVVWNGRNNTGMQVSSGTYFCRVRFEKNFLITKLILIK